MESYTNLRQENIVLDAYARIYTHMHVHTHTETKVCLESMSQFLWIFYPVIVGSCDMTYAVAGEGNTFHL